MVFALYCDILLSLPSNVYTYGICSFDITKINVAGIQGNMKSCLCISSALQVFIVDTGPSHRQILFCAIPHKMAYTGDTDHDRVEPKAIMKSMIQFSLVSVQPYTLEKDPLAH